MNASFLTKLLTSLASNEAAPKDISAKAKSARLAEFKELLRAHNVRFYENTYEKVPALIMTIGHDHFPIRYKRDVLTLEAGWLANNAELPVATPEQVLAFARAVQEREAVNEGKKQRREKLRKLRIRAIQATVQPLAEELGFKFFLREMIPKVKLVVRLSQDVGFAIDLPYRDYEKKLEHLPFLVKTIREFMKRGLSVKLLGSQELQKHYRFP